MSVVYRDATPTTLLLGSTLFVTTEFDPTLAFFPIIIGPNICAPEPTIEPSSNVGCLFVFT